MEGLEDANLRGWILQAADGEEIEAVVIGEDAPGRDRNDSSFWNRVLTWAEAEKLLTYEFDSGFGNADCQAITAWTKSKVIFVSNYDGSTHIEWVPRNPANHEPNMPGGG